MFAGRLREKSLEGLLKIVTKSSRSFEYIFENYNNSENFMFLDPPYDSEFTDYGYCTFGKDEQVVNRVYDVPKYGRFGKVGYFNML